jgi:hypothetical protein
MTNSTSKHLEKHTEIVKRWPRKAGKAEYLKFLRGEKLTRAEALKAKCYECVCGEDSGQCLVKTCPLLLYSQWGTADSAEPT